MCRPGPNDRYRPIADSQTVRLNSPGVAQCSDDTNCVNDYDDGGCDALACHVSPERHLQLTVRTDPMRTFALVEGQ
jgi:hypothetical protein